MKELSKIYDSKKYEDEMYRRWEQSGFFNPDICIKKKVTKKSAKPFSIVLPPPNVTGTLHMGHAVMLAIQDVLIRYHRMIGDKTLWVPGTDHAAIATESKVEKILINKGIKNPKAELGREKLLQKIDQFAKESHDTIVNQCKKMGASLDWSREAFTLDKDRNHSVNTIFKMMYEDGLIYRGYRVVNWSVKGQSTCSDDELVYIERPAKLYTFFYSHDCPIPIATTRPETKLGDTAIAVHPGGKWNKHIGQTFFIKNFGPWNDELRLRVIASENIDENFGTGALGVTPAHSHVDFDLYEREKKQGNDFGLIQVINELGCLIPKPKKRPGFLPTEKVREEVIKWLKSKDLLVGEPLDIMQNVATSDRFGDIIEPLPKMQWFIDVNKIFQIKNSRLNSFKKGTSVTLKSLMQQTVKTGQINIIPDRFNKTYFHWIDNLRDWCISRQIWYGHRIPVYYNLEDQKNWNYKNGNPILVSFRNGPLFEINEEKFAHLQLYWVKFNEAHLFSIESLNLLVKEGITDWETIKSTASSSSMFGGFPFEHFNKPEIFIDHSKIPSATYIQDPDTLDTWFSSGLWTFSTLGWPKKTSDLKTYHPTTVLETGYDILFFWVARMILMTTYALGDIPFKTVYLHGLVRDEQGRKMSKSLGNIINPLDMIEKYGTDATRLSLLIGSTSGNDSKLSEAKVAGFRNFTNKLWNISRFMLLNIKSPKPEALSPKPKTFFDKWILARLYVVARSVSNDLENYNFSLAGEKLREFTWNDLADWYLEIAKKEGDKDAMLNYLLNYILKLWHPFMPFVTEAIWSEVYGKKAMLMVEEWPVVSAKYHDKKVESQGVNFILLIKNIRAVRAEKKIPPLMAVNIDLSAPKELIKILKGNFDLFKELGKLEDVRMGFGSPFFQLEYGVDKDQESARINKEIATVEPYVVSLEKKLGNEQFVKNAPAEVVEKEKQKLSEAKEKLAKLQTQLGTLV